MDSDIISRTQYFTRRVLDAVGGDNTITQLQFYMTRRCNLACPGCYMHANPSINGAYIDSRDIDNYVREFANMPNFSDIVVFSGGEIFTLPTQYLAHNIQNTLNRGCMVELKTNASWIDDAPHADEIIKMLGDLNVSHAPATAADDTEIEKYLSKFSRAELSKLGKEEIFEMMMRDLGTVPMLQMAVSVDNKIHPTKSADWFIKLANRICGDARVAKNVGLETATLMESMDFFMDRVINSGKLNITASHGNLETRRYKYTIGKNYTVISAFSEFIDTTVKPKPEDDAEIIAPGADGEKQLVYLFWPDKTVSFQNCRLQPVGRVPYVDARGRYKGMSQLREEMVLQLVKDYFAKISR